MRTKRTMAAAAAALLLAAALPGASLSQEDPAAPAGTASRGREGGRYGLGVIFGEPTGLSGKMWTTERTAFDLGAAWSFQDDGNFHLHVDYLFHNFGYFDVEKGALPFYLGIGGRVRFEDDSRVGIRFVLGLEYFLEDWPFGLFVEVAPIIDLAPETEGDVNGGLGARFYF